MHILSWAFARRKEKEKERPSLKRKPPPVPPVHKQSVNPAPAPAPPTYTMILIALPPLSSPFSLSFFFLKMDLSKLFPFFSLNTSSSPSSFLASIVLTDLFDRELRLLPASLTSSSLS